MKKRLFALFLAIVMVVAALPVSAFAEEELAEEILMEEEILDEEEIAAEEVLPEEEPVEEEPAEEAEPIEEEEIPDEEIVEEVLPEEEPVEEEPLIEEEALAEEELLPEEEEIQYTENYTEALGDFNGKVVKVRVYNDGTPYTGRPIEFPVEVISRDSYGWETYLTEGVDYKVSYKNNVNAGKPGDTKSPQVIITGKGNYTGKIVVEATIAKADIWNTNPTSPTSFIFKYTGKAIKPKFKIEYMGKAVNAKEFTVTYPDTADGAYVKCGGWTVEIKANDINFTNVISTSIQIVPQTMSDAKISMTPSSVQLRPDGSFDMPKLKVTMGKKTLVEGMDYIISGIFANYVGDQGGYCQIEGIGDYAGYGYKDINFKVKGIKLTDKMITLMHGGTKTYDCYDWYPIEGTDFDVIYNGQKLKQGDDYYISEIKGDNIKVGKFTVTFMGMDVFTGTVKKTFTITPRAINTSKIYMYQDELPYVKGGYTKDTLRGWIDVYDSDTGDYLQPGVDYTITVMNGSKVADKSSSKAPAFYITGKGNYTGSTKAMPVKFSIVNSNADWFWVSVPDIAYTDKAKNYIPKMKVCDSSGKEMKAGTDYTAEYLVWNPDTCVYEPVGDRVSWAKYNVSGRAIDMRVRVTGKGLYYNPSKTNTLEQLYCITKKDLSKAKVTVENVVFDDYSYVKPKITVVNKENGKSVTLVQGYDYEISVSCNYLKAKGEVTIYGIGEYSGSLQKSFKILPKTLQ